MGCSLPVGTHWNIRPHTAGLVSIPARSPDCAGSQSGAQAPARLCPLGTSDRTSSSLCARPIHGSGRIALTQSAKDGMKPRRVRLAGLQPMFLDRTLRRNKVKALLMEPQIEATVQADLQIVSEVTGACDLLPYGDRLDEIECARLHLDILATLGNKRNVQLCSWIVAELHFALTKLQNDIARQFDQGGPLAGQEVFNRPVCDCRVH